MSKALQMRPGEEPERKAEAAAAGVELASSGAGMADLPALLSRATGIINKMLESLRAGQQVLQAAAVEKLHNTNEKLHEISSATETAATDIMDGIDRAFVLLDQLEGDDVGPRGAEIGGQVRDELFQVMTHLQFQDITTQQLDHAASIIQDMEHYLDEFAELFNVTTEGAIPPLEVGSASSFPRAFDPCASTRDAKQRQAIVDQILTVAEK
jgi:chemotaxis regulatin CheY-phosphate phosphatase CheZ